MIDLDDVIARLDEKQKKESTWDKAELHVSDLSLCKRQVWARRNGMMDEVVDTDNFIQRSFGLLYESILCKALTEAGVSYQYQVPISKKLFGHKVIGTADFVFEDSVVDAKTTTFWSGYVGKSGDKKKIVKVPDDPRRGYRIQAESYAIALDKPKYGIQSVCRSSGKRAMHWYLTGELSDEIGESVIDMQETALGDPEPFDAKPPSYTYDEKGNSWQCAFCQYGSCEFNVNEKLQVI